jgi:hypothetical protein
MVPFPEQVNYAIFSKDSVLIMQSLHDVQEMSAYGAGHVSVSPSESRNDGRIRRKFGMDVMPLGYPSLQSAIPIWLTNILVVWGRH